MNATCGFAHPHHWKFFYGTESAEVCEAVRGGNTGGGLDAGEGDTADAVFSMIGYEEKCTEG